MYDPFSFIYRATATKLGRTMTVSKHPFPAKVSEVWLPTVCEWSGTWREGKGPVVERRRRTRAQQQTSTHHPSSPTASISQSSSRRRVHAGSRQIATRLLVPVSAIGARPQGLASPPSSPPSQPSQSSPFLSRLQLSMEDAAPALTEGLHPAKDIAFGSVRPAPLSSDIPSKPARKLWLISRRRARLSPCLGSRLSLQDLRAPL